MAAEAKSAGGDEVIKGSKDAGGQASEGGNEEGEELAVCVKDRRDVPLREVFPLK